MGYLISNDYLVLIQDANLQQIITSTPRIRVEAENAAQAEAISYLRQKYDTTLELKDTTVWDFTAPYSAYDRVYLDASAYVAANTYNTNDLTLYSGNVYQCLNDSVTGTFNPSNWLLLGAQYDVYYALPPYSIFDLYNVYNVGDKVFYKGNVYTCLVNTPLLDHETGLQYRLIANLPYQNVFPDDPQAGTNYWHLEDAYIIPANTDINNESVWSTSDNRDQQLRQKLCEITLFHLHKRIAPRNIPQLRIDAYMGAENDRAIVNGEIRYPVYSALGWLQACARGEITPNLPLLQPKQGNRIRFGGNVKNINSYDVLIIFGIWKIIAIYTAI